VEFNFTGTVAFYIFFTVQDQGVQSLRKANEETYVE
jgi:hypothetical protein